MKEGQLHKTSGTGVIDAFLLDSGKGTVATFTFFSSQLETQWEFEEQR